MVGSRAVVVFLFAVAGLMTAFVVLQSTNIYHVSKAQVDVQQSTGSYECLDYTLLARDAQLAKGMLTVTVVNPAYATKGVDRVMVESGKTILDVPTPQLVPGGMQKLNLAWNGTGEFKIYVPGCSSYSLACSAAGGACR